MVEFFYIAWEVDEQFSRVFQPNKKNTIVFMHNNASLVLFL